MLPQAARSRTGECMITDNNGVDKVYVHSGGTVADRWYRCTDVVSVDGSSGSSVSMASNVDVSPQKKVPKKARKEGKGKGKQLKAGQTRSQHKNPARQLLGGAALAATLSPRRGRKRKAPDVAKPVQPFGPVTPRAPISTRQSSKRKAADDATGDATGTTTEPVPRARASRSLTKATKTPFIMTAKHAFVQDTGGHIGRELVRCFRPIVPPPLLGLHAC